MKSSLITSTFLPLHSKTIQWFLLHTQCHNNKPLVTFGHSWLEMAPCEGQKHFIFLTTVAADKIHWCWRSNFSTNFQLAVNNTILLNMDLWPCKAFLITYGVAEGWVGWPWGLDIQVPDGLGPRFHIVDLSLDLVVPGQHVADRNHWSHLQNRN